MSRINCLALLLAAASCGERDPSTRPRLTVFAAASTTDVVTQLTAAFAGAEVRTSFGPSSGLARQIEDGAPAGVFVSAHKRWIGHLERTGALGSGTRVFCRNRIVCIAMAKSPLVAAGVGNAAELLAIVEPDDRIAIADAGVPAGDYARQSLAASGTLTALRPRLVGQEDVRHVLRAVESGQAVAGFVYSTDVRVAAVEQLFTFDSASHEPIEYFVATTAKAVDPTLANAFVDHLCSPLGREILVNAGFEVANR